MFDQAISFDRPDRAAPGITAIAHACEACGHVNPGFYQYCTQCGSRSDCTLAYGAAVEIELAALAQPVPSVAEIVWDGLARDEDTAVFAATQAGSEAQDQQRAIAGADRRRRIQLPADLEQLRRRQRRFLHRPGAAGPRHSLENRPRSRADRRFMIGGLVRLADSGDAPLQGRKLVDRRKVGQVKLESLFRGRQRLAADPLAPVPEVLPVLLVGLQRRRRPAPLP